MTIYTAYLPVDAALWLTGLSDLLANNAEVTHTGYGVVTIGERAKGILEDFSEDDDGYLEIPQDGSDSAGIRIWVEGQGWPVIADDGNTTKVLGETIAALPEMPLVAREVTARLLIDVSKRVLSETADAAVVDLTRIHLRKGGYEAVGQMLGKSTSAVNKAVDRHNERAR